MNVIKFANVENGANSFKFLIHISNNSGMRRIKINIFTSASKTNLAQIACKFVAVNIIYTQQIPS